MPITQAQREQRRSHLGSSDMAAILGLDPWSNAYDVYLQKTDRVEDRKESKVLARGNYLEPAILNYAEDKLGKLIRNQYRVAEGFPLAANVDAIVVATGKPVEAKSQGAFVDEFWGDEGGDEIPDRVIIQAHVHMLCTNQDYCHVPVYLAFREFQMFGVAKDSVIIDIICDKSMEFWEDFIEKDIPPPDVIPSFDMAKRMRRTPGKVVKIDTALIVNWQNAKETLKMAEAIKEGAEAEMLAHLGDADGGECDLGLLTYLEQSRRFITPQELKDAHPEIYAKLEKVTTFRVPRLKKPRKPKF